MAKKKVEEDEIDELLEDLEEDVDEDDEDLEDEVDEDDEDVDDEDLEEDDEEDPDEAPKARKRKGKAKKKAAKKERTGIGTAELAAAAGTDSRSLRMFLRAKGFEKREGRYEWKSLNDPEARKILKAIKNNELKDVQQDRIAKIKGKKKTSKKAAAKKSSSKKTKARSKK